MKMNRKARLLLTINIISLLRTNTMKRRAGSHNIKQNEAFQSVQSSLITTIKDNKRVQTKNSVMAIVCLAKSTKWKHDPPMKRQNVCETHSNGTKSPNEETLCVGKLLNRNEST